jgi:uncharacterized protein (TIGR03437 family)
MWSKVLLAAGMLAPAFAQTCTYSLSRSSDSNVPAGGAALSSVSVIATGDNCAWTAVSNVPWMRVTFGQSGKGNGSFGPAVDPNSGPSRTGTITAAGLTYTVTQNGCSFAFSPSSASYPFGGGSGSFTVTPTPSSCTWTGTTTSDWITMSTASGGPGTGVITYAAAANPTPSVRIGNITVGGQSFPITEAAAPCVTTLAPGTANVAAGGASGSFRVTVTPNGCTWTASSANAFVTVTSGASGTNSGTVGYSVAANAGSQRSGAIRVNDQSFNLTQDGAACAYTAIPDQNNFGPQGGSSAVAIATSAGCAWTAASNAGFITITGAASGSGPTRVGFSVTSNAGAARSGAMTVAGQTVTISQEAGAPPPPGPQVTAVNNSASNQPGPVSPGEAVTLVGSLLGPSDPVTMQTTADGSSVTTSLGATRVLFDGVAAPMIYASAGQAIAVAPYGLDGKTSTQAQVEVQGTLSNTVTLNVAPSAPAVYSADGTGAGPGAVLNQDYSVNAPGSAAAIGTVIQIFATGGGRTTPAISDGKLVTTPLPQLNLPVAVRIGGIDAIVQYAGGAPGLVAGLMQVNAVVPDAVQPGDAVPLVVQVGAMSSPDGITIAVGPAQ